MKKKQFDEPVRILGENGAVREIATPMEAYTFLASRKTKKIDLRIAMLRKTCSAASVGLLKPQVARTAFAKYAEKHGILAPQGSYGEVSTAAAVAAAA